MGAGLRERKGEDGETSIESERESGVYSSLIVYIASQYS